MEASVHWKADKSTTFAAIAVGLAGTGRIIFAHDFVLGGALIAVALAIAARTYIYNRKPGA
jgi:hypothetical protein